MTCVSTVSCVHCYCATVHAANSIFMLLCKQSSIFCEWWKILTDFWKVNSTVIILILWSLLINFLTQVNLALHSSGLLNWVPASAGVNGGKSILLGGSEHCVMPYGMWFPTAVRWFWLQTTISDLLLFYLLFINIAFLSDHWSKNTHYLHGYLHFSNIQDNTTFACKTTACGIFLHYDITVYQISWTSLFIYYESRTEVHMKRLKKYNLRDYNTQM